MFNAAVFYRAGSNVVRRTRIRRSVQFYYNSCERRDSVANGKSGKFSDESRKLPMTDAMREVVMVARRVFDCDFHFSIAVAAAW